ncbi:MAG: efflux RND transporter periplasmic adaptor subunit [Snowella sp.]|nr:efflux RND transporter periplasmic adaptor subunit [Snowella sp.]
MLVNHPLFGVAKYRVRSSLGVLCGLVWLGTSLSGCGQWEQPKVEAQPSSGQENATDRPSAVDVMLTKTGQLRQATEYTGTTAPIREVSLRSQVEGQLQTLTVDVGDRVESGQILARLNDDLLLGSVAQAQAQKAAQRSQVATARSQAGDAQIKVEQARLQLQQAQADIARLQTSLQARIEQARLEVTQTQIDAERFSKLAQEGVTAAQTAEQSQTKAKQAKQVLQAEMANAAQQISQAKTAAQTAAKILRSAEAQVAIEQQKVTAATSQVKAQKALVNQAQTRQSYATLRSPLAGKVLKRATEPGNLVQPGTEILRLGDFSRVKINVDVSERELNTIQLGQSADITLDAFPKQRFTGTVSRISPSADPATRLIPIEVTLHNPDGKIGSGLFARVSFSPAQGNTIIIPESALQEDGSVFVVQGEGKTLTATQRAVEIGQKANGKLEILSGLSPNERLVVRSSKPLQNNSAVRFSVLSETKKP